MIKLRDFLSQEEIEEYHKEWGNYSPKSKFSPETSYNVHSGLPVIGKVFRYAKQPVFRAHVFKRQLKKFDPYQLTKTYFYPYFHGTHYILCMEQLWHASMSMLDENYHHFVCADIFDRETPPWMGHTIDFRTSNTSLEMVIDLKLGRDKLKANGTATFYDDGKNKELQIWPFEVFGRLREYVRCIERLKQGGEEAREELIRKIKARQMASKRLLTPRENPKDTADYLIEQLRTKTIPEDELHDFFSFWDR